MSVLLSLLMFYIISTTQGVCPFLFGTYRTMEQRVDMSPRYVNCVPKTVSNGLIDNICLTYFLMEGSFNNLLAVSSWVLLDNSSIVNIFLVEADDTRVIHFSSERKCFAVFPYPVFPNQTTDYVYSLEGARGMAIGITSKWKEPPRDMYTVLPKYGFDVDEYTALPMNLPSRCVTYLTCRAGSQGYQHGSCTPTNCY